MNLDIVRDKIKSYLDKNVIIDVYGMRNKNNTYRGVLSGVYPYVFTVNIDGTEKSFNYADVIIGDVVVKLM